MFRFSVTPYGKSQQTNPILNIGAMKSPFPSSLLEILLSILPMVKALAMNEASYDQPRQHIKKLRHYFANKCSSSQSYGFSSGHVWM